MPVITETEEGVPERRRRTGRGFWLLLVPPVLALLLLAAAAIQPVQLGPHILAVELIRWPKFGWTPRLTSHRVTPSRPASVRYRNRDYVLTGRGYTLAVAS